MSSAACSNATARPSSFSVHDEMTRTFGPSSAAEISFFARQFYWLEHATTAWLMEKQIGFAVLSGERGFGLAIVNAQ